MSWKVTQLTRLILLLLLGFSTAFADSGENAGTACCCVGVVVAILAAIGISENKKKEASGDDTVPTPPPDQYRSTASGTFELKVVPKVVDGNHSKVHCFDAQVRGPIALPPGLFGAVFRLTLWDVTKSDTEKERQSVLCSLTNLQMPGSQVFSGTNIQGMPGQYSTIPDWATVFTIPIDSLIFPSRGRRKLRFTMTVSSLGESKLVALSNYTLYHENMTLGYIDGARIRLQTEEMGLKLAAAVSAVDGQQDDKEKLVVRKWMDSRIGSLPENLQAQTSRTLSRALMIAERMGSKIKVPEIKIMCQEIIGHYTVESMPRGDVQDVVSLCYQVAAADGTAGDDEMDLIRYIGEKLHVDSDVLNKLRDKAVSPSMYGDANLDNVLGLSSEMTPRQQKKHLNKLLREWSAKVTHSDPKIVADANAMIDLITRKAEEVDRQLYS